MALVEFRQTKLGHAKQEGLLVLIDGSLHAVLIGDPTGSAWVVEYATTVLDDHRGRLVWGSRRSMKQFFRAYGMLTLDPGFGSAAVQSLVDRLMKDEDQ